MAIAGVAAAERTFARADCSRRLFRLAVFTDTVSTEPPFHLGESFRDALRSQLGEGLPGRLVFRIVAERGLE
jgi:hypothetical protein